MSSSPTIQYRPDIDGLRALAVVAVIIFHLNPAWLPGGFLGVDFFFVISGYLITAIIYKQAAAGRFSFVTFYTRRIKRILPLFFTVLFVTTLASLLLLVAQDLEGYLHTATYAVQFRANFAFGQSSYFDVATNEKPLLHLWSLAVEEQFYFVWPLVLLGLFWLFRRQPSRHRLFAATLVLLLAFAALAQWQVNVDPAQAYYMPWVRAPELLLGCAMALWPYQTRPYQRALGCLGLAIMLGCLIFYRPDMRFPGLSSLLPTLGVTLFIYDDQLGHRSKWLFQRSGMILIGLWSFSLYLWHWPILALMRYVYGAAELPYTWLAVAVMLMLVLTVASYYGVEKPVRHNRLRFWPSLGLIYLAPAALLWGLVALSHLSPWQERLYPPTELTFLGDDVCYDRFAADCTQGDPSAPVSVLMVGDSYTAHLAKFIDVVGRKEGWRADVRSVSACSPVLNYEFETALDDSVLALCQQLQGYIKQHWDEYDVIFLASRWSYQLGLTHSRYADPGYEEKFIATLRLLSQQKPIYVFSSMQNADYNPLRSIKLNQLGLDTLKTANQPKQDDATLQANARIKALVAEIPNVHWVDMSPYLPPSLTLEGKPMYMNNNHLNAFGSRKLGQRFSQQEALFKEHHESTD
ncbi:MAG: acyltransferase [Neisseriaceae bacterium]|nr:acyltransferase [Neisseriaceae bacterium]MBP6860978.1 acyltransferase [Neisseriaceae bacterium]